MDQQQQTNDEFVRSVIQEIGQRTTKAGYNYVMANEELALFLIDHGLPIPGSTMQALQEKGVTYHPSRTFDMVTLEERNTLGTLAEKATATARELQVLGTIYKGDWERQTAEFTEVMLDALAGDMMSKSFFSQRVNSYDKCSLNSTTREIHK